MKCKRLNEVLNSSSQPGKRARAESDAIFAETGERVRL
jgi:hypothetical protein